MTTIIHNPGNTKGPYSEFGIIIGIIVFLIVVGLFFIYGLPLIRRSANPSRPNGNIDVNVQLPTYQETGNQTSPSQ